MASFTSSARPSASDKKYHRQRTIGPGPDGEQCVYDSKREAAYAVTLDLRRKAGDIASWERQVRVKLMIGNEPIRPIGAKRDSVAVLDFIVWHNNMRREIHEVKGYVNDADPVTRLFRLKLAIIQRMWPDVEIIIVH